VNAPGPPGHPSGVPQTPPDPPGHPSGPLPTGGPRRGPPDPSGRTPPARLVVGRVLRPHGVRGELAVEVLSDAPDRFSPGAELAAGDPDGPGPLRPLTVTAARLHLGRLLLRLEGVEDRDAAGGLRGAWLSIPAEAARPLGDDEYWPHQLVGLAVVDHQGRERGRVADVLPGAAHDLLAVALPAGGSALVPAVAALVTVELEAGRVLVDDLPGLLDPPAGPGGG
jgi:16S rRNA processing protein RimM